MADSSSSAPKPTSSVKLVLLGEAAVGKSSLVLRFVNNDFQENKEPTIGAAFLTQKCALPNRTIKFEIWDTAGQERFASLAPMYYRNAQAALVVYDITKASSLTKAQHWVAELQRQASPGIVIALVGNKFDLTDSASRGESIATISSTPAKKKADAGGGADTVGNADADAEADADEAAAGDEDNDAEADARKVSTKQARSYADAEGLLFFETSAKTGLNVAEVFTAIASSIPETQLKGGRGGAGGAGGAGASGQGGRGGAGDSRIDLGQRSGGGKDSCAC